MNRFGHVRSILKATLPISKDLDLDMCINSALLLAMYYHDVLLSNDFTEDSKKQALALVVAAFDKKTIHYLEDVIEDFKEEVFYNGGR